MTTIKDVAFRAGVSIATVSHVINNSKPVRDATVLKVNRAIQELGYRHNRLASALKSGSSETGVIAMLIPGYVNPFFSEMVRCVEQTCSRQGYVMMLCHVTPDIAHVRHTLDVVQSRQIDGLLYTSLEMKGIDALLQEYQDFPSLLIDFDYDNPHARGFDDNDVKGGYLAAHYLLSLGHRKIACVTGGFDKRVTIQRLQGYRKALDEFQQPYDEALILEGNFHQKSGYDCFMQLYSQPDRPGAIIAHNDMMAIGIQSAAYQLGVRIPEDLSLVGYDDIELASFACPPLTTVKIPTDEIADQAVSTLIKKIKKSGSSPGVHVMPKLVIRQSTAKVGAFARNEPFQQQLNVYKHHLQKSETEKLP